VFTVAVNFQLLQPLHYGAAVTDGLRERKKREQRRLLSDTATRMFLQHGFDAVRVVEVAAACGVSEKTVYNYFPTKEALVLDQLTEMSEALAGALADPGVPPLQAVLRLLDADLDAMTAVGPGPGFAEAAEQIRRFGDLIRSTPSLRAYATDSADRAVAVATQALAFRQGVAPEDPEPQITARALVGLWQIQSDSLRRRLPGATTADALRDAVRADVRRAARVLASGLD
jgi:AcrR family transcriptional regulator